MRTLEEIFYAVLCRFFQENLFLLISKMRLIFVFFLISSFLNGNSCRRGSMFPKFFVTLQSDNNQEGIICSK